ncbi:hypothetical protein CBM2615_B60041 [Cupriavidus taiwanensis]|nr:hypothetical protein CBM2615_B60041 [Cupriavidus taiwanensis]
MLKAYLNSLAALHGHKVVSTNVRIKPIEDLLDLISIDNLLEYRLLHTTDDII